MTARIESWNGRQLRARMNETMAIYAEAMGYAPYVAQQRASFASAHTKYDGFHCRVALDERTDAVVGFCYGYSTHSGQWWHDAVREALTTELAAWWLPQAFELSELHVHPRWQGARIGENLLVGLLSEIDHRCVLLSTPEGDTRAFRLYRRLGFVDLARQHLFPGDRRPFAVLGATLPLSLSAPDGA
jgi:ribosomal protein S18 acetylase RimI-like enzyme